MLRRGLGGWFDLGMEVGGGMMVSLMEKDVVMM